MWSGDQALPFFLVVLASLRSLVLGDLLPFLQSKSNPSSRYESINDVATVSMEMEKVINNSRENEYTIRKKRNVMQMARMLKCISGCNPLSYRGYGCYCGYKGSGQPVDDIDRCCLQHDWCYTFISCPQSIIYFVPYTWQCMPPATAQCGVAYVPGVPQKCATQLCECDREFARCVSNYPCPQKKPECKANNYVMLQAIMNNNV